MKNVGLFAAGRDGGGGIAASVSVVAKIASCLLSSAMGRFDIKHQFRLFLNTRLANACFSPALRLDYVLNIWII